MLYCLVGIRKCLWEVLNDVRENIWDVTNDSCRSHGGQENLESLYRWYAEVGTNSHSIVVVAQRWAVGLICLITTTKRWVKLMSLVYVKNVLSNMKHSSCGKPKFTATCDDEIDYSCRFSIDSGEMRSFFVLRTNNEEWWAKYLYLLWLIIGLTISCKSTWCYTCGSTVCEC